MSFTGDELGGDQEMRPGLKASRKSQEEELKPYPSVITDRGECKCVLNYIANYGLKPWMLLYELGRGSASEKFLCKGRIQCSASRSLDSHCFMKCDSQNQGGWRNGNTKHMSQEDTVGKQAVIVGPSVAGTAAGGGCSIIRPLLGCWAQGRTFPWIRQWEQTHHCVYDFKQGLFSLHRANTGNPGRNPGGISPANPYFHRKQLQLQ